MQRRRRRYVAGLRRRLRSMDEHVIALLWARHAAAVHEGEAVPEQETVARLLDQELARREKISARKREEDAAKAKFLDELIRRRGLSPEAAVARLAEEWRKHRQREARRARERRLWDDYWLEVYNEYLQAERDCRGHLYSKRGLREGPNEPTALWNRPAHQVAIYASEELKEWWRRRGGRLTFARWKAKRYPSPSNRRAAERSMKADHARGF